MQRLSYIFVSKATRVSVSSLLSILTPIYLTRLGYSSFDVGLALTAILAGNAFFNIILTWYGNYLGRKRALLTFSLLLLVSGVLVSSTTYLPLILSGLFLGNISTTNTDADPSPSVVPCLIPRIVPQEY